jgi:hypothetical protein
MRLATVAAVVPLAVLVGCGSSSTSSLLVLDRSAGPVRLREPRTQVEDDLGHGTILPAVQGAPRVYYPRPDLTIWYASKGSSAEIYVIQTTSPRYRTKSGIGVGTTFVKLRAAPGVKCYGENGCQHVHAHNQPGTVFRMGGPNGAVSEVLLVAAVD